MIAWHWYVIRTESFRHVHLFPLHSWIGIDLEDLWIHHRFFGIADCFSLIRYEITLLFLCFNDDTLKCVHCFETWICQWWEFCIIVCLSDISVLGYGNVTPQTFAGRLFCILYGLIGIPFTLLAIADVGKFVSEIVERWQKAFANFTGFVHISMSC